MRIRLITLMLAAPALAGCAAITSTTNTIARTADMTLKGTTQSTESSMEGDKSSEYAKAEQFVNSQFVMIRREAASGGGEHTAALARLMGAQNVAAFDAWLQAHYASLFTHLSTRTDLVKRIAKRRKQLAATGASAGA